MPNEQKKRIDTERLLHGLSRLEVPAGLEQRVISRLRNAPKGGAHLTRHGALYKLTLGMAPLGLVILMLVGIGRESPRTPSPRDRALVGRNLSVTPGSNARASDPSAMKAGELLPDSAMGKLFRSGPLAKLKVSAGLKLQQDDSSTQNGESSKGPNSDFPLETASGQTTNAEILGTAIQGTQDFAVPGDPLPRMRAAGTPGAPLPQFEIAAAPGTPLPSFTETTKNGD